jgi:cytoskeleton protein RodZ
MQVVPASAVAVTPEPQAKQPETPAPAEKQSPRPVAAEAAAPPVASPVKPSVSTAPLPAPAVKPTVPAATPAANLPAKPAATPSASLSLKFGDESWTEVRDASGNVISSQLNPAGSELVLKGQGPFSLVIGRASTARLIYKGKVVDLAPHTNATSDVARLTLE